jgi:diguanylate cyclase (GGDEF)-like protein
LRVGECYCGRAAATGVTVIGEIGECEEEHCRLSPLKESHGHIVVPLKSRGRTYGVMCLCTRYGAVPQPELVDLIETLGGQIGVAVENARLFQETKNLALHDALTGLGNRRILDVFLEKHYSHSKRTGEPFAIVMADIDHFKKYNDEHGHDEGDRILSSVGRVITESVREMDIAVRFGGEEFIVLAPEADIESARVIAERIRVNIKKIAGVTISLGVSQYRDNLSAEEIIKKADEALYAAKHNGRDRVEVADLFSSI